MHETRPDPLGAGEFVVCRLYGIDAPKGKQAYGDESTHALKQLILGQQVQVRTKGRDQYGRKICFIRKGTLDINVEMIRQGHAWAFRKYLNAPHTSAYVTAEDEAKENNAVSGSMAAPGRHGITERIVNGDARVKPILLEYIMHATC